MQLARVRAVFKLKTKKHHHDVQSELQELWASGLLLSTGVDKVCSWGNEAKIRFHGVLMLRSTMVYGD